MLDVGCWGAEKVPTVVTVRIEMAWPAQGSHCCSPSSTAFIRGGGQGMGRQSLTSTVYSGLDLARVQVEGIG